MRDIFLFESLSEEELKEIESFSKRIYLKKGDIVFYEKELPLFLHIILKGEAVVYKVDSKGNELIVHKFNAPSLIAELANLENIPYPANCKVISNEAIILKIDFKKFSKFLHNPKICVKVMNSLLKKMRFLDNMILNTLVLDVESRIAKFIYENEEAFLTLKQHNIAKLLKITPETLSRKLKKFKKLGIIENKEGKLVIKDKEAIKNYFSW